MTPRFRLPEGRPAVMGILNVTPDSFSDGGRFLGVREAIDHGRRMAEEGADILDVGGESTRPGAEPVSADEELRRVLPVVEALVAEGLAVSIDTSKATVARACTEAGAAIVNDVTAWSDPEMGAVCAEAGCAVCLMHMQGTPRTMQASPQYADVVAEVCDFLATQANAALALGLAAEDVWLDPGIGFGKDLGHNLRLLADLGHVVDLGHPVLVGASRKSFIGRVLDGLPPQDRLEGTLAAHVLAQSAGARILRVHDVLPAARASRVAAAILAEATRDA